MWTSRPVRLATGFTCAPSGAHVHLHAHAKRETSAIPRARRGVSGEEVVFMTSVDARHSRLCPPNYKTEGKMIPSQRRRPISSRPGGSLRLQMSGCFNAAVERSKPDSTAPQHTIISNKGAADISKLGLLLKDFLQREAQPTLCQNTQTSQKTMTQSSPAEREGQTRLALAVDSERDPAVGKVCLLK